MGEETETEKIFIIIFFVVSGNQQETGSGGSMN